MSVEVDTGGAGPTAKLVRMQATPEYIPTISGNVIVHGKHSAKTKSDDDGEGQLNAKKQWGRIKNVAQIQNEAQSETFSDTSDEESPRKPVGIADFQRTAKLFIQSKKVIKKVKSRYSGNAMRKFLARSSSSLNLSEVGTNLDSEMFNSFNLTDMHFRMRKKRHLKLAVLQQQFLNDLPSLAEMSVKERLTRKIELLEKIKNAGNVDEITIREKVENEKPPVKNFSRRQSRLRKSMDHSNFSVDVEKCLPAIIQKQDSTENIDLDMGIPVADIERDLALFRSRERIESDLNLPEDRLARFAMLKSNVERINAKFISFKKGNKTEKGGMADDKANEEKLYYVPSRFTQSGMARSYFKKYARLVLIVTQWINLIMNKKYDFEKELKSFVDIANEIEDKVVSSTMSEFGLSFDKKFFKANKEISLSSEVRKILTTRWWSRTPKMIKQVLNGLQYLRSLSEYPIQTQEKLCKVAWYQTIGPKKLIVRQGHHAESFYFILSGMAFVKKMIQDPVTGETKAQVAARLTKGHSFGEIGLLFDTLRTATVESATPMELLVIGKEDFVRIFMKAENPDDEPEHIQYLRKIPFMKEWPIDLLKLEPGACLTHYFKRGSLITDNDRHSEWLYIVMSGTCEVLKKLKAVRGRSLSEMRPKSDPMSDIILPELGMPNNHAKIYTGKSRTKKRTIHPQVFQDMTDFYDSLRRRLPSREKLRASYRPTSCDDDVFKQSHTGNDDVFVQVELLHPRQCFGLNTLRYVMEADDDVFDVGADETPILSLVSRGAEVIMLSKKVFLKYADQRCKIRVREQIKVYPSENVMQDNMQREADWSLYKETLLNQYIEKKLKHEKPRSKSNMY
ncbi:uncharacterized protein LOC123556796 isoform X2 [Mercenaria mercenaria]|uniref:uncharacterized protein LOC123556796 isoform X2 n=1 Tax=Mercenaria mercenaria TaxID=6596 RepID=UPI00234ED16B|nr:uncharacterized protein LOC123556796 isoform X2 [Mercenaria mercenaria]